MSPRLRLKNYEARPNSRDIVDAVCYSCAGIVKIKFIELVRRVNSQAKFVEFYRCPVCYRSLPQAKEHIKKSKRPITAESRQAASEKSKSLWRRRDYRQKCVENCKKKVGNKEFAGKISVSLKQKFATDHEYVAKVSAARKRYWDDRHYAELVEQAEKTHEPRSSRTEHVIAEFIEQYSFVVEKSRRDVLPFGYEVDIFVPSKNVGIEYHGAYRHSYNALETANQKWKHHRKATFAAQIDMKLLQFYDFEWARKEHIVKSMILNSLGLSARVFARTCEAVNIDNRLARKFFNDNHLKGFRPAHFTYALMHKNEIVLAASFVQYNEVVEIMRLASKVGVVVIGGLSKIISHLKRNCTFKKITTYADRRYATGVGYLRTGFEVVSVTRPGYYYYKSGQIYDRRRFQKHKLPKLLPNFDSNLTEAENMFAGGYRRIWDAGNYSLTLDIN